MEQDRANDWSLKNGRAEVDGDRDPSDERHYDSDDLDAGAFVFQLQLTLPDYA